MPRLTPLQRLAHAGLAAALTLGLAPSLAFAEEPGEQSDAANRLIEQFAQQSNQKSRYAFSGLADTSAYNYDPSMPVAYIEDILPKEFYMKDRGWTTPVKNQAPWGTCWAFASIAAAEASITSGLMAAGKAPSEPVDLSELHTAWFSCMPVADKDNPQYNEGIHIASNDESPTGISAAVLDRGGFMYTSASVFSNGVGPVYEKDVPYKNKSGETVKTTDGRDLYYERGDWFVDEEQHFGSAYELKESLVLPSPATFIDANKELVGNPFDVYGNLREDVSYKHDYDADAAIKKELWAGRAVTIAFHADTSRPEEIDENHYINAADETWAHYTWDMAEHANHAVTIVGWNDNYEASNFIKDCEPKDENGNLLNGAWLVKNSWGTSDENAKFPNWTPGGWGVDGEGYFWLSYHDPTIMKPESFEFDISDTNGAHNSYYINQHDYMPSAGVSAVLSGDFASMVNVFTAEGDQDLYAISCETATPNTRVVYQIVRLNEGWKTSDNGKPNPLDGEKLLEGEGQEKTFEFGGYHRIDLGETFPIAQGEQFAVLISESSPVGNNEDFHTILLDQAPNKANYDAAHEAGYQLDSYAVGIVNPGESFLVDKDGKGWEDLHDIVYGEDGLAVMNPSFDYDNFAIKAYGYPTGIENVETPGIVSMSEADALAALEAAGLAGEKTGEEYSATVPAGCVISQDPAQGVPVAVGSTVHYVLSSGPAPAEPETPAEPGGSTAPENKPNNKPGKSGAFAKTGDPLAPFAATAGMLALGSAGAYAAARARQRKQH